MMVLKRVYAVLTAAFLGCVPMSLKAQAPSRAEADSLALRAAGRGPQWAEIMVMGGTGMYVDTVHIRRTPEAMHLTLRWEYAEPMSLGPGRPYYGAEIVEDLDCDHGRARDLEVSALDRNGRVFKTEAYPHQEWKTFQEHAFLSSIGRPLCLRIGTILMFKQ
ncbi:surface-adhesin E family protein [Longimicrobium sp.]|uniref:surface-adhesin E family protein n=1 Tax=Longimicrobium sp. TaxID=2029185 RepID=UPI002C7C9C5B|nr:surface-adhesin E family protein [Longimicrobium sp.]HSU16666.1 surface-adhesin E family protein [Longimicrobium sp.]